MAKPIHRACDLCKGACCTHLIMNFDGLEKEVWDWVSFHGKEIGGRKVIFETPCRHLLDGKCNIYKTRPFTCQMHPVGGPMCLDAIFHVHGKSGLAPRILAIIRGTDRIPVPDEKPPLQRSSEEVGPSTEPSQPQYGGESDQE
jgi:hypothetical protein